MRIKPNKLNSHSASIFTQAYAIAFVFAFTILGASSANADNFCSYGHGSGGGGMIELADGSLSAHASVAMPTMHTLPQIAVAGLQQNNPAQLQQSSRINISGKIMPLQSKQKPTR